VRCWRRVAVVVGVGSGPSNGRWLAFRGLLSREFCRLARSARRPRKIICFPIQSMFIFTYVIYVLAVKEMKMWKVEREGKK
jgi:hypothetical protein